MSIFWESAKKLWIKSRPVVALVLESKVLWYEDDDNSMFLKKKPTGYLSIARAGQFRELKGAKSPL